MDKEGNELIFTGDSFQVYYTEVNEKYQYVGMCMGDSWTFLENNTLEKQTLEKEN